MAMVPDGLKKVSVFLVVSLILVGSASAEEGALSKMLHSDGSFNLESRFSGSLDPSGYRMVTGPDRTPRFVPTGTSVASPEGDPDDVYWDDQFCTPLAQDVVEALASDAAGNIYVGGWLYFVGGQYLTNPSGIVKWNGSSWSELAEGVNGTVYAIAVDGTEVYVGGEFTEAGGVPASNVAKWDGEGWSALGSGTGGPVHAIAVKGSEVYVGGTFVTAGEITVNHIAKWNGASWSALGSGVDGVAGPPFVQCLAVMGENVYAGGRFDTAGGASADHIAKWDGSSWSALGSGTNTRVYALAVIGSDLYAGGPFVFAGGVYVGCVAKWDGTSWSSIGAEAGGPGGVHALAAEGTHLYAAGRFSVIGATDARGIAKWDGSNWSPLGAGLSYGYEVGLGRALTVSQGYVYAGGLFEEAGSAPVGNIARWDGSRWSGLGSGMDAWPEPYVYAITVDGSDIYIGGDFEVAGGIGANNIVKWDGLTWSALGSGTDGDVLAIAVGGSDVYAGGEFTTAGGVSASYVAKWDGSSWHSLGSGTNDVVWALTTIGTDIYAGGWFGTAGGISAAGVARWDGSSWYPLGSGLGGGVSTLTTDGANLYADGWDAVSDFGIAKWNGSEWSFSACNLNSQVWAVAASNGDIYAGGMFNLAGSTPVNSVAQWDGSAWSAFGSGLGGMTGEWESWVNVWALATVGDALLVGGEFASAGGKPSFAFARWMPRVNVSHLLLTVSPGEATLGNDLHGFYKPALMTESGTTVSYPGGLPADVTMEIADEIHVGGVRVNGAFTLSPEGVAFGGTGATLRVEFSEDDVAAYVPTHADDYTDFCVVRLTYPLDYPVNKEAAEVEILSYSTGVPIRVQNGRQIYAISIPFSSIASTYGAVPQSLAQPSSVGPWLLLD